MTETKSSRRRTSPPSGAPQRRRAEFKTHFGALTLFVDDRPRVPIILNVLAGISSSNIKSIIDKGMGLVRMQLDDLWWPGGSRLDSEAVDAALKPLFEMPDTHRFLLSIRVDAPQWWLGSNPKECVEYARRNDGGTSIAVSLGLPVSPSSRLPVATHASASMASTRWRQSAADALDRLLRHVLNSPVGNRLVGVQLLAGEAGAWVYPEADRLPDTGPCMTLAFIKYTVDKYRRNEGLLRKAWFDTRAEFSGIRCPGAGEREKAEFGLFRNPHRSRKLMDYYECMASEQASAALSFCAVVKRASGGDLLVGLESAPLTAQYSTPECVHTFPDQILSSKDVDFFVESNCSGSSGLTADVFRPYRGSAALNSKFVFVDSGTAGVTAAFGAAAESAGAIVGAPESDKELSDLAHLASAWEKRLSRPQKAQTQIALILDPGAGLVVSHRPDAAPMQSLMMDQIATIRKAGVVFSTYSIGDLFHPQFPDHKVNLFPNCFYMSEPERRKLDARIKRSGQTAVWFWSPGIIGEDGINAEAGAKCCGQKLRVESTEISLRTRIVVSNDPLTWGRHAGEVFGLETPASPRCTVADGKAIRLGANSDNKTSFSVRRFDSWTSVVYGTLPVPLDLLQNLFRSAACHVYCATLKDGDRISSDGRVLCLSSRSGGSYSVSLPGQFDVIDIRNGSRVAMGVSEIPITLSANESALFELKSRLRNIGSDKP